MFNKFMITTSKTSTIKFFGNNTSALAVGSTSKNNTKFANKYAIRDNSLYYLDTDYTVARDSNGYTKLNIHKVDFTEGIVNDINLSTSTEIVSDELYADVKLNGE